MNAHRRRAPGLLIVPILALLLLAGCDPASPQPSGSATQTPGADPTPTATAEPSPPVRFDVACEDLSSPAVLAPVLTAPVDVHDPAATALVSHATIPAVYAVRSLGGLACEWSNGERSGDDTGAPTAYVGGRVSVLPDAVAQWNVFAGLYLPVDNTQLYCTNTPPIYCSLNKLVGTYWIEAILTGVAVDAKLGDEAIRAAAAPFFDPVVEAISGAGDPGPRWSPPEGTIPLPGACDDFIAPGQVAATLQITETLGSATGHGGWSLDAAAFQDAGGLPCTWLPTSGDISIGTLAWIAGGAWAERQAMEVATIPSVPETLALTGLQDEESASIRCIPGDEECWVDVRVGGNWVQVSVSRESAGSPPIGVDRRTGVTSLAQQIVDGLRP